MDITFIATRYKNRPIKVSWYNKKTGERLKFKPKQKVSKPIKVDFYKKPT